MKQNTWMLLGFAAYVAWIIWGCVWLLPRKRALLAQHPGATNDDFIRMAKTGHPSAQLLRRDTWRYIAVGLAIGVFFAIIRAVMVRS